MKIEQLVKVQEEFFNSNDTKSYAFRIKALKKLKKAIISNEDEILLALKKDLNKSNFEGFVTEIGTTIQEINYFLKNLKKLMSPRKRRVGINAYPGRAFEISEPYGRVLIISPWNYPFNLSMIPLIGAIAAGNCAVLKPSEYSPNVTEVIKKIIREAFDDEYISVVIGGVDETKEILNHRFDYIFFTGSISVGRYIMEKAARFLTPVTLELGGKSPVIVTKSANIKKAARRIIFGKLLNSGQTCVAPDYILVDEGVKDKLLKELVRQIDVQLPETYLSEDFPKIISERHLSRLKNLIKNEDIFYGGKMEISQNKMEPTIVVNIDEDSKVMQEEIFGPILPIIPYKKLDEAISFVKDREKPLALYLFTRKKREERRIIEELSFGGGCINDTISHLAISGLPFGGVGSSGIGNYHGINSFKTFSHTKSLYKKGGMDLKFRYGPYNKSLFLIKKLMK